MITFCSLHSLTYFYRTMWTAGSSTAPGSPSHFLPGSASVLKLFILVLFADFEASFIRLVDKITNGSIIEVNETGKRHRVYLSNAYSLRSLFWISTAHQIIIWLLRILIVIPFRKENLYVFEIVWFLSSAGVRSK